jgi:hypothetical protein
MKVCEVIANRSQKPVAVQPSVVKQQTQIGNVMANIAASDQRKPPTELEKVLAMRNVRNMKKRTDKAYADRLRQQLANADNAVQ